MTLDDFERQLAAEKKAQSEGRERRHHSSRREAEDGRRHHKHHHRSHRASNRDDTDSRERDRHRSKRLRIEHEDGEKHQHNQELRHRKSPSTANSIDAKDDSLGTALPSTGLKRDSWMEAPSSLDVDIIHRPRPIEPPPPKHGSLAADFEMKIHRNELNHHLRDLQSGKALEEIKQDQTTHEVNYTFGDAGSQWRMTRLKAVYRQAKETGRLVDEVALERYDSLRDFDDAREEQVELDRRQSYGQDYVGKEKPNGDLFQERKQAAGIRRADQNPNVQDSGGEHTQVIEDLPAPSNLDMAKSNPQVDQTTLNKMKAQLMKAQLRKDPDAGRLQAAYDAAVAASSTHDPAVVTLSVMDNRMLSSAPRHEVKAVQNRRGAARGQVEENEDMSIEDMVREERRTRGQAGGEGQRFAERIAKDGKFDNDLDYLDENASKLAKRVQKSEIDIRNTAIHDIQKLSKILDHCPLCHHEDTNTPPIAPVVSLATRTFLTLSTEPELVPFGAVIVPLQHRTNLLEADDDEWEEMRNFMKSLIRLYDRQGQGVIFYENAAHPQRRQHAALVAVPLPRALWETAPAFFQEAFLTAEDEWSQHKKIIDTLARAKNGLGKLAFRRSLAKEMPYFHVWFEMDGGMGHIVEDGHRWPRGDLFAREVIGGMFGMEADVVRRQGKWQRGQDTRVDKFRRRWKDFDWTTLLTQGPS